MENGQSFREREKGGGEEGEHFFILFNKFAS